VIYALAIPISLAAPFVACALYVVIAGIWLLPNRRIETALKTRRE
jgi:TMEM175 potassium channel family protein